MRSDLSIRSAAGDYDVVVREGAFAEVLAGHAGFVLADDAVLDRFGASTPFTLHADEATKTLRGVEDVVLAMREAGVRRGDRILAVGGGVVQDVATFAAAIYLRGVDWVYAPTTLMAMTDSCIGGKSSLNAGGVKNLVGGFHPPAQIVIDPGFLQTLQPAAISAGLAEAVKICFCKGPESFATYLELHERFPLGPAPLLLHTLRTKAWFVEVDEFDQKERRLLNFGHTFGHALESALGHRVSHGTGVALGMLCALAHPAAAQTDGTKALEEHCRQLLSAVDDLREVLAGFDVEVYERAFRSDKKHSATQFRLILPAGDAVAEVGLPADDDSWGTVLATTTGVLESVT